MEFIFDLLVLPDGPRLRDKLSHGEVYLPDNPDLQETRQIENRLRSSCQLVFASIHDLVKIKINPLLVPNLHDWIKLRD